MRMIYLDCSMGAAGDMLTAALLELCDEPDRVLETLNRAFAGRAVLSAEKQKKMGLAGTRMHVLVNGTEGGEEPSHEAALPKDGHDHHGNGHEHHHHHTSLKEVRELIGSLPLPEEVLSNAIAVYDAIAAAEATVHGQVMENIHFHEVGTLDAMADVVSVCCLMHELQAEKICASPVHVGSGTVRCAHGVLPVPAPATQELLKGIPIYGGEIPGELCTPTGAALLKHYVSQFGSMPMMRVSKIGYGLGKKDFPRANGLRAVLGETGETGKEQVIELACNLDDMTGEELAFAQEQLFLEGALDVTFTSIGMKKSRPGVMLTCMCRPEQRDQILRSLFRNTTSLGVREYVCNRYVMKREMRTEHTEYGPVRIKRSEGCGTVREKAEFEDLKKIAQEHGLPLREVRDRVDTFTGTPEAGRHPEARKP